MRRRAGLAIAVLFLSSSVSVAQQDGKALAQRIHRLPHEEVFDEKWAGDAEQFAVWRFYVRPDRQEEFDAVLSLFTDIVSRALNDERVRSRQKAALRSLRILPPSSINRPLNESGPLPYLFVAAPYHEHADYSVLSVLKLEYSPDRAEALYRTFRAALADPDVHVAVTERP